MTIAINILGVDYDAPSSAADTNWAADQVALEQALATGLNNTATDLTEAEANITALQGNRVKVLSKNVTPVGNGADTTEDNLMTYTVPGGTLASNGQCVRVTASGIGVNTADATTVRAYFGSALLGTLELTASQVNSWRAVFEVFRTGASAQVTSCVIINGGVAQKLQTTANTGTETLASDVVLKFTGQRASTATANSVQQLSMVVELLP